MCHIAIFHPTDPMGSVPGGIESIIRGILKWSPPDLHYTLFGATSDDAERPVGLEVPISFGGGDSRFMPLVTVDRTGRRGFVPAIVRYMQALRRHLRTGHCAEFDILDFHRVEPLLLFTRDSRPKNIILHQDMSAIRDKNCDIMWRHAPWLYDAIERRLLSNVDHIFAVRQSAAARYQQTYSRFDNWASFLPTWVDATIFFPSSNAEEKSDLRARLRLRLGVDDPDVRILVTVGRLDKQKDPLLLLNAFREVLRADAKVHLVIIGDGILRPAVARYCATLGLKGLVSMLGVRSSTEIAEILRASDLFVLTSAYEGMPIAALEALASGIPVVSTNVGEIPLIVKDGINGAIAPNRTAESISAAFLACLRRLSLISGIPCEKSVVPYHPQNVLHLIYANHRTQGERARSELRS